jgi:hypothetical protein
MAIMEFNGTVPVQSGVPPDSKPSAKRGGHRPDAENFDVVDVMVPPIAAMSNAVATDRWLPLVIPHRPVPMPTKAQGIARCMDGSVAGWMLDRMNSPALTIAIE